VPISTIPYRAIVVGASDRRTHRENALMSSRPLAALASLVLAVLGFVFLIPDCASACMCVVEGTPKERTKEAISDSDAVFSGELVDFENTPFTTTMEGTLVTIMGVTTPSATATLRVSEVWKGPKQQTVQIATVPNDGVSCGYPFEEGREYLVYAYTGKQGLTVDGCGETKPLSKAGADLTLLGNSSEKPKDGDDEALSDTSGGVSGRAMVGMAGLMMAASFLLVVRFIRTG
jgi:hypothetical protein